MAKGISYISHISAAQAWGIEHLSDIYGGFANSQLRHLTVSAKRDRLRRATDCEHIASWELPADAVVLRNGELVASPALLFLESASLLDFHHLVLLGLTLCGHQAMHPEEALTTACMLQRFLSDTPGMDGHRHAERAAQYVIDGSASVMESILYMIFALPYRYGGFGLDGAEFNRILLAPGDSLESRPSKLCVDLFWEHANLVVEYDSRAFHNNPISFEKDTRRVIQLKRMGHDVVSITAAQLYDRRSMAGVAEYIAGVLGKRLRIRNPQFEEENAKLFSILPRY